MRTRAPQTLRIHRIRIIDHPRRTSPRILWFSLQLWREIREVGSNGMWWTYWVSKGAMDSVHMRTRAPQTLRIHHRMAHSASCTLYIWFSLQLSRKIREVGSNGMWWTYWVSKGAMDSVHMSTRAPQTLRIHRIIILGARRLVRGSHTSQPSTMTKNTWSGFQWDVVDIMSK